MHRKHPSKEFEYTALSVYLGKISTRDDSRGLVVDSHLKVSFYFLGSSHLSHMKQVNNMCSALA